MNHKTRIVALVVSIAGATGYMALAGPLNPPPGPVAPTYKTLTEVEPRTAINATNTPGDADSLFKITQSGSYYLTGNITGVVGKHGIEIAANGVTLDLNGFDLVGVPAMGAFDGVSVTVFGLTNIAVVNGSVRNWGDKGVDLSGQVTSFNCRLEGVIASGNTSSGILTGNGCTITNCSAFQNTGNGITTADGCTISNCSVYDNTADGINTNSGCVVLGCTVYKNGGRGVDVATGSTVADCSVRFNTLDGILGSGACVIRGNACTSNGFIGDGAGIHVTGGDNRIEGNNCTGADRGIDVDSAGNFITRNICSGNTTNWDIVAGNVCLVVQGVAGAAILGNTGGVAPGSTDPNANFTY